MHTMRLAAMILILSCAAGAHVAHAEAFKGVDITGQGYSGAFRLAGHDGSPRTPADFAGKVLVVTFGFTRCADSCPIALATLARLMDALGEDAKNVQAALITVDPERDTPGLLAKYVTAFQPTFLGLSGDAAQTRQAARAFKVFYQKVPAAPKRSGDYTVDHSTGYYALDRQGRVRLLFRHSQPVADMAHDIRLLLRE
jgi:protein SCO1/2